MRKKDGNVLNFFTIANNAYLPKAVVLARSARNQHPRARFYLILADRRLSSEARLLKEEFDQVISLEELPLEVENRQAWQFQHSVVELCTALKAQSALTLFEKTGCEKLVYLDPDIFVASRFTELEALLESHEIVLTPHQLNADRGLETIFDNEVTCLRNGAFNLGFLALRSGETSHALLKWWNTRLMNFCFDDPQKGFFTDQKWFDLVPLFFKSCHVLRESGYNVATWNLSQRRVTSKDGALHVNGSPLRFFHFSGFDSGAQFVMLKKYGLGSPELFEFRRAYAKALEKAGQARLGQTPWSYGYFNRGTPISSLHRKAYRGSFRLKHLFPDPYRESPEGLDFESWSSVCGEVITCLGREGLLVPKVDGFSLLSAPERSLGEDRAGIARPIRSSDAIH